MFLKILILLSYNIFYEFSWVHLFIFFYVSTFNYIKISNYTFIFTSHKHRHITARVLSINYNSYYPIVVLIFF